MSAAGMLPESIELALETAGTLVAPQLPVQLQCSAPGHAGLLVLAEGGMGVAEVVQDVGGVQDVAGVGEQAQGLLVVLDGLPGVALMVGDVAEAVQRRRLT